MRPSFQARGFSKAGGAGPEPLLERAGGPLSKSETCPSRRPGQRPQFNLLQK